MRNDFESNYLAHHGILGMKWGKKNGPPYPLGSGDHSASEKKAGWKKSLGGGRNEEDYATTKKKKSRLERAADAAQRDADNLRKYGYKEEADAVQKVADRNREKAAEKKEATKITLSEGQKRALKIGLGVAAGAAIVAGSVYVAKQGKIKVLEGLAKESKQIGEAYVHEFMRMKRNSDNAYKIANAAAKQGNKSVADLFNMYGDRFMGNAEVARQNALAEEKMRQTYDYAKKTQTDYIVRKLTGKPRQYTKEELTDMGIKLARLDPDSLSGDSYNELIEFYMKQYGLK